MKMIIRFLVFFLLFACVPLLIACLLALYSLSLEENSRRLKAAEFLNSDLSNLTRRIDPSNYLQTRFSSFAKQLYRKPLSSQRMHFLWKNACKFWGVKFDLYVFDSSGLLITPTSISLRSRNVLQKIWNILRQTPFFVKNDDERFKKYINTLLGSDFRFAMLELRKGRLLSVRSQASDGLMFWDSDGKPGFGGIVLAAWEIPSHGTLLNMASQKPLSRPMVLVTRDKENSPQFYWAPSEKKALETVVKRFDFFKERWFFEDGKIWVTANAGDLTLFAGRTDRGLILDFQRKRVLFVTVLLIVFLFCFWFRWIVQSKDVYLSIRIKLVLLFVFAILIPMMGVTFLGFRLLQDREEIQISESLKAGKDALISIDTEFKGEIKKYQTQFRKFRKAIEKGESIQKLGKIARKLEGEGKVLLFEVRDLLGKPLFTFENATFFKGTEAVFEVFSKICIERNLQDRLSLVKEKPPSQLELLTSMVFESPEMGFAYIMDRPNVAHPLQFATNKLYWYWDVFHDQNNPAAFLVMSQSLVGSINNFLKIRLSRRETYDNSQFRLFARWDEIGTWYPDGIRINRDLENLMERVRISHQPVEDRVLWHGKAFRGIAIPGNNIEGHSLLALYPEEEITRSISTIRRVIVIGMIIAFIVAVLTGVVLSDTFLVPIEDLSHGIQALRGRDTSYRVRATQKDELGDLGSMFNRMVEGLKEMELAKIVQESLIPREMPHLQGYSIELVNLNASDLGGDYCDVTLMQDGRILLVIGDVTGHGVSSALLMAMAKAVVFQFAEHGDGNPLTLMKHLNKLIFRLLQKRKMMTFFAAVIDQVSGKVTYSNAGHPFPLLCKFGGASEELKIAHYPLGFSEKKARFQVEERILDRGDVLFLYTDGLVESLDKNGKMFGYKRILDLMTTLQPNSVGYIKDSIISAFREHRAAQELDDDLTMAILKRDP